MQTLSEVTASNKFNIKCARTGQFIAGAVKGFDVISVSMQARNALAFDDREAAEKGCNVLSALYPNTVWQSVEA
jgi:hypothetical protein